MSYYRTQLEHFLSNYSVKADRVYDVGGIQKPVKDRTKSWNVTNYEILDIPEYDLNVLQPLKAQADLIFCLEVFEYLIVPTTAMTNIYNLLKPNGTAIVSFPLVYPLHNEVEFDSLRYTITGVRRLADYSNLNVKEIHYRKAKSGTLVKYYQEDGMKMAKHYNHDITGYIAEITKK